MRYIGFSHGVLHRILNVYSKENINELKNCGCNAIEINCNSIREVKNLNYILFFLGNFEYVSLHLPNDVKYSNNKETKNLLKKIENFYIESKARLVVVHPDLVEDWDVFDDYQINWAVENMDDRKVNFKNVADFKSFFEKRNKWSLALDLGHCNANDKTMFLADEFISAFKTKIREIHLSGYDVFHNALYKTKQIEIIKYCNKLDAPIIIDSPTDISEGIDGIKKEYSYVLENMN